MGDKQPQQPLQREQHPDLANAQDALGSARPWGPWQPPMAGAGAAKTGYRPATPQSQQVGAPAQPVPSSAGSGDPNPAHSWGHGRDRTWPWDTLLWCWALLQWLCRAWQVQRGERGPG